MSDERELGESTQRDLAVVTRWCKGQPAGVHLEVLCAESPPLRGLRDQVVVRLTGCLADACAADLAELAAASRSVVLRVDGCTHRAPGSGATQVTALLAALGAAESLQVWMREPGGVQCVAGRAEHGVRALPAPRRALFGSVLATRSAPQQGVDHPGQRGLDHSAQRRVVLALRTLIGGAPVGAGAAALPADALDLHSSGCTACGTCVKACPTGVLALRETAHPGGRSLTLDVVGCIGCGDCVTLCPADALSSDGPLDWGRLLGGPDEVALEEMLTRTCRRCRTEFAGGAADRDLCLVCAERRANPFGSTLPPRYVSPHLYRPPGPAGS